MLRQASLFLLLSLSGIYICIHLDYCHKGALRVWFWLYVGTLLSMTPLKLALGMLSSAPTPQRIVRSEVHDLFGAIFYSLPVSISLCFWPLRISLTLLSAQHT